MITTKLFDWFTRTLSEAYCCSLPESPAIALAEIGVSPEVFPWLLELTNHEYPLKIRGNESLPDLESRCREAKRSQGQYFTPEHAVFHLLQTLSSFPKSGAFLDPACGDGGFLLPLAGRIASLDVNQPILDSIHGFDIDPEALLICLGRLLSRFPRRGVPHLEKRDFLFAPPENRFRLVLGNPPYRVNLPEAVISALAERYSTAEGEKDLYTFFLEAGIQVLEPDGELLMLTSHSFLVNHQCEKIRKFLFTKHQALGLYFLPFRFFPKAPGVLPVITHIAKACANNRSFQVFDKYSAANSWQSLHSSDPSLLATASGLAKIRLTPRAQELFRSMVSVSQPLGSLARVGVGIQESLKRGNQVSKFVKKVQQSEHDVPVLRGREIDKFRVSWDGNFITYGPHLTYSGPEGIFRGPKILYQNLRNESLPLRLVAALDLQGFFPKNSLSYVAEPKTPFSLAYLVGLLNSPIVNAWFAGSYFSFHVTVTQVRTIPIPLPSAFYREAIEEVVQTIMNLPSEVTIPPELESSLSTLAIQCYFPDASPEKVKQDLGI